MYFQAKVAVALAISLSPLTLSHNKMICKLIRTLMKNNKLYFAVDWDNIEYIENSEIDF